MKGKGLFLLILVFLFVSSSNVDAKVQGERSLNDETIYFLMIDRFNNSDFNNDFAVDANDPLMFHGGDFQGIIDRLDYIKEMGFTMLALSPIFASEENSYHGYVVKDYWQIEKHFGTIETFKQLVDEAHARNMKVMIDFVVDKEALANKDAPADLIAAAKFWITETKIDGYRLTFDDQTPLDFLEKFITEVKQVKTDFFLLADSYSTDPTDIEQYMKAGFDGFLDYPSNEPVRAVFEKTDQSFAPLLAANHTYSFLSDRSAVAATFMDNDRTTRFTRDTVRNNEHPGPRWKLALTYLYTTPGVPIVYYGSEIALDGGEGADNHRQMDFRTDLELVEYIGKIGKIRADFPALTKGSFEVLSENNGVLVYKREYNDQTVVIAVNNSSKTQSVSLTSGIEANKELRGLLAGDLVRSNDSEYKLVIDRDEAEIYLLADRSGLNFPALIVTGLVIAGFLFYLSLVIRNSKRKQS